MSNYTIVNLIPATAGEGRIPAIKVGDQVFPMQMQVSGGGGGSMDFYKCATVSGKVPEIKSPEDATSNTGTGYTISVSSIYNSNYEGWKAFNGVEVASDRGWFSEGGNSDPQWLQILFSTAQVINFYSLNVAYDSAGQHYSAWKLQASNDGSTWTDLDVVTGQDLYSGDSAYSSYLNNSTAYSYYRIYFAGTGGYPYIGLQNVKLGYLTTVKSWTGYKAVLSGGKYSYESTVTSGLTYGSSFTPEVGKIYSDGALIQATLYQGGIPLDGVLCYAMPDTSWVSGQPVSAWGDFSQADPSKQPKIATIGGVTGIKARNGDVLSCNTTAPTGNFSFLAKFYVGSTADDKLVFIAFNSTYGAVIGFESGVFFLSKQGVDSVSCPVNKSTLGIGTHNVAVTYSQSTGETKFYFDGVLTDTETYYNADFEYSGLFRYAQEGTSDNLILGLAAYNRVLSAAEIAGINW